MGVCGFCMHSAYVVFVGTVVPGLKDWPSAVMKWSLMGVWSTKSKIGVVRGCSHMASSFTG